jgi:DNA-binding NtrC family response regulator
MNLPLLMVVDDEKGVRESLKMVFAKDFQLLEADSVDAALPQVEAQKPSVVLLDILMPKTDGIEVLRQIKQIHPRCKVIMLTALNTRPLIDKALECGAFDVIGKPFDIVELRGKVNRALSEITQGS